MTSGPSYMAKNHSCFQDKVTDCTVSIDICDFSLGLGHCPSRGRGLKRGSLYPLLFPTIYPMPCTWYEVEPSEIVILQVKTSKFWQCHVSCNKRMKNPSLDWGRKNSDEVAADNHVCIIRTFSWRTELALRPRDCPQLAASPWCSAHVESWAEMADDLGDEWWENQPTGADSSPGNSQM